MKLSNVSSRHGAPMGRKNTLPDNRNALGALTLERLAWVDGDYDEGGAYWGATPGTNIFRAFGEIEGEDCMTEIFVRATSFADAERQIKAVLPGATLTPDLAADFLGAYIEAALWSSTDPETGEPLDAAYSSPDLADATLEQMRADCAAFWADNHARVESDAARAGRDFWLTRNRHGAGFWDGDWPLVDEKALTDAAHAFGEVSLYVGDDGKIYA